MNDAAITLVELAPTIFGKLNARMVEDAYCMCRFPARAISLLHAILARERFSDVRSISPGISRDGRLSPDELRRIVTSNFLLLSAITRTIPQTRELALFYKERRSGGTVIVGGPHASYLPEECLEWADVVVRGEGDKTLPTLLASLLNHGSPEGVRGVSYRRHGEIIHEEPVEPLTERELSDLPAPYYDGATLSRIRVLPICTSRGCPFTCDFCSVWKLYGRRYRRRSNESIIEELKAAYSSPAKFLFFIDDNFSGKPGETKELLRMMIASGLTRKPFLCQLSVYAAFDHELLSLLKKAGGFSVFLGIESINDETLRSLNKKVDVKTNKEAVRLFTEAGFWVNGMMMIGGDGDTEESLKETTRWAGDNLDSVQYFTPTPLPGTCLAETMSADGRVLSNDYYLYDGQYVVVRPRNFTPLRLQTVIFNMYRDFYSLRRAIRDLLRPRYRLKKFTIRLIARGTVRAGFNNPQTVDYMRRLKTMKSLPASRSTFALAAK